MEGYRYVADVNVRFRDLDTMGHVNNAVYATYLEEARIAYYDDVLNVAVDELGFFLAHVEIDYERPVRHGEDVRVGIRTTDIGDRSMTTEYRVEADGETAATAETVQVAVDEEGVPAPVPEDWRRSVEEFESQ
jgi:acyl-CoA thioester hydrolase